MSSVFYNFTYDGTFEGLLCVLLRCISTRVIPKSIQPDYLFTDNDGEDQFTHVVTNDSLARKLYDYIGTFADVQVQQMVRDCFLTSLPNKEIDIYMLIRQALWRGNSVSDDFSNESLRRIQMAIRDLYRESQSIPYDINFSRFTNTDISIINPRNIVLPVMMDNVLKNTAIDDFLLYDRRHKLALLRRQDSDYIVDTSRIATKTEINHDYVYNSLWKHFIKDGNIRRIRPLHVCGKLTDNPTMLWDIAK